MNQVAQILNAAIVKQLSTPMSVCAWHKKYFPAEPILILVDGDPEQISHGICERCEAIAFPKRVDPNFEMVASIVAEKMKIKAVPAVEPCQCVGCRQNNRYGCIQNARPGDQYAVFA